VLDAKDIEILLFLQENPIATLSQISEQINLSVSNTSTHLKRLIQKRIFRGVHADFNISALELEIYDFFFTIKEKRNLLLIEEQFSHHHPYILYRTRCSGKQNGLFVQFRAPKNTLNTIIEVAETLVRKRVIEDYHYLPRNPDVKALRVKSSLRYWNPAKKTWEFDWALWKEGYRTASHSPSLIPKLSSNSILQQLSELDIKLLAELSMDARKKNVEMVQNIGIEEVSGLMQKVSRRVRFLKERAIEDYRVFLHWPFFDLYQYIAIRGHCNSNISKKIYSYLAAGQGKPSADEAEIYFPFTSLYYLMKDGGFFWYVRAPPSHTSEFLDFIWEVCPDYELYLFDYKTSQIYGLWAEAFDWEKHQWKTSHEFLVGEVLKHIL